MGHLSDNKIQRQERTDESTLLLNDAKIKERNEKLLIDVLN